MRALLLVPAGLLLLASPVGAQDFSWHGAIAAGKTLEVRGINGSVTAVAASGGEARVTATKRAHRHGNPDDVEIKVVQDAEGVLICAVYPSRHSDRPNECGWRRGHSDTDNNDTEVDFQVQVPAGVAFVGSTVNGDAEARNLPADARLSTVNGDVDVSASGTAEASTVNGSVRADVGKGDWSGALEFNTVNGGITVTLPQDLSAEVAASTVNGSIESDFPLTVQGRIRPRSIHATIGSGGRDLELKTVNGSIRLVKRS
ncbi:MAG TPA: DUF4097 family beta strand repeat-containing protein [Gemmatimonadales bacterium]|nr:DUF4097 family beta strand repeat-containing protein [Gemmatimonadales bacterium]